MWESMSFDLPRGHFLEWIIPHVEVQENIFIEPGRTILPADQTALLAFKIRLSLNKLFGVNSDFYFVQINNSHHPNWLYEKVRAALDIPQVENYLLQAHNNSNYSLFYKTPLQIVELGGLGDTARMLFANYGANSKFPLCWRIIMAVLMVPPTHIQNDSIIPYVFSKTVRSNFRDHSFQGNYATVRLLCPITQIPNDDGDNIGVNFYLSMFQQ